MCGSNFYESDVTFAPTFLVYIISVLAIVIHILPDQIQKKS